MAKWIKQGRKIREKEEETARLEAQQFNYDDGDSLPFMFFQ